MNSGKHSQNFNFVGNATFICYCHSYISKFFHLCDGFVMDLFAGCMILSCIMGMRDECV